MTQKHPLLLLALAAGGLLAAGSAPGQTAGNHYLWQIGARDGRNAEFALAPGGYERFASDGLFVVGESTAARDWPYVQPGPSDGWAKSRPHTFVVLFGLKALPAAGEGALELDFLDTHGSQPPKIRIEINGRTFERNLAAGGGDDSLRGTTAKARPSTVSVSFPTTVLRKGDNEVRVTTVSGSWLIYDWLGLEAPAGGRPERVVARTLIEDVVAVRALAEKDGRSLQPVVVNIRNFGETVTDAVVHFTGGPANHPGSAAEAPHKGAASMALAETTVRLEPGRSEIELLVPSVLSETRGVVAVEVAEKGGRISLSRETTLKPVPKLTVYILPHSHTDIGYTEIQTNIEKKQVSNLVEGMAAARRTAGYPAGARFVWNVEVLWAADLYLHRLDDGQRADFLESVKKGQVVLNGMYLNELTGLCRPEELVRLFRFATVLSGRTGVPIDSVMISDVPGYTWGTVTAMAQAGIKYFSTAPNYFDRIGTIMREWENRPFYWVGPDRKTKVLVWIPFWGYAMSHIYREMSSGLVGDFCDGLEKRAYPYDIAYVRWSGHGDNAVPDPAICEFVRDWDAKYAWPRFVISGTGEAFTAFEKKYGDRLPRVEGDWTPYWEDGAGSSALETGLNRWSSDRLAQAETVFALRRPEGYPAAAFEDAWNSVLLYSEHTWGAWCSVSGPERQETKEQWAIKKSYADRADRQSKELLARALATPGPAGAAGAANAGTAGAAGTTAKQSGRAGIDVINTLSWPRTEIVRLTREQSAAGDRVTDVKGQTVRSQRLATGELAFLAGDVPPLASERFFVTAGRPGVGARAGKEGEAEARAAAAGAVLDSGLVRARVSESTGGIVELTFGGADENLVDTRDGQALNDYLYLIGDNIKDIKRNGPVRISVGERGPLVASLVIESDAPGCKTLRRELRVAAGRPYLEITDLVDKERLAAASYMDKSGKESVNFGFPFSVPDGDLRLDLPLGVMRPEADQIPSACKNWLTVGRWADVSNRERGVTWITIDAPLVEVVGITANLLNSQFNPDVWRKSIDKTQKIYSWAMNNHWGTNYRAYQEGPVPFRFIIRPHGRYDEAEASRFATGWSQPLLAVPAAGPPPSGVALFVVEPADVLVTGLKPSDDGRALIIRLFGASGGEERARLKWGASQPKAVYLSDTSERPGEAIQGDISVPAHGLVTLRAELP